MNHSIIVAGFGGQGILFAGKFLTYLGLLSGANVSWLPSYGPEMRGGTANCGVVISADKPVGSPIVLAPDLLIAMNPPSLDKFEPEAQSGATVIIDSSLISRGAARDDIRAFCVPATRLAEENGLKGLANMIAVGKLLKETDLGGIDEAAAALEKTVPASKRHLLDKNIDALRLGMLQ